MPLKDDLRTIARLDRDLAEPFGTLLEAREERKLWQGVERSDLMRHSVSSLISEKAVVEPKKLLA